MLKRIAPIGLILSLALAAPAAASAAPHIIGGSPGGSNAVVSVYIAPPDAAASLCSGSVISPTAVLTAAHCVVPGATYQVSESSATELLLRDQVTAAYVDPSYNPATYDDDAAVLVLETPIDRAANVGEPTPDITPLVLSSDAVAMGTAVIATGWGNTADGLASSEATAGTENLENQVSLTVEPCGYSTDQICAGAPGSTLAPGDSGGALIAGGMQVAINDEWYGYAAPGTMPSVFTPISEVYAWVQGTVASLPMPVSAISKGVSGHHFTRLSRRGRVMAARSENARAR